MPAPKETSVVLDSIRTARFSRMGRFFFEMSDCMVMTEAETADKIKELVPLETAAYYAGHYDDDILEKRIAVNGYKWVADGVIHDFTYSYAIAEWGQNLEN